MVRDAQRPLKLDRYSREGQEEQEGNTDDDTKGYPASPTVPVGVVAAVAGFITSKGVSVVIFDGLSRELWTHHR